MKLKLLFLTLIFAAAAITTRANTNFSSSTNGLNNETRKSDIAGGVIHADTKKPLSNVTVTAYSATKKEKVVYTDANGNYSFTELKDGTYKLVFEKEGLKKVTKEKVVIQPEGGCMLNVEMNSDDEFLILTGSLFDF